MENDLISRRDAMETIKSMHITIGGVDVFPAHVKNSVLDALDLAPAVEAEPVRHGRWEHVKKHYWRKDEFGNVDMCSYECGYHNGPSCEVCYESFCENCDPDWAEKECTVGHYVCSACGHPEKTNNMRYCPNCGAKMDGGAEDV